MTIARVSNKGQITLPAKVRRSFGIKARSRVDVTVDGDRIVLKPIKSAMELSGILRERVKGMPTDPRSIRSRTIEAVAEEVANEGLG